MDRSSLPAGGLVAQLGRSPTAARVAPFAAFVLLTFCQGKFGEASRYWFYFAKTLAGVGLVWWMRPRVEEMTWRWSWEAVLVGSAVFVMWVGLDGWYPSMDRLLNLVGLAKPPTGNDPAAVGWNPHAVFGSNSALAWMFIGARVFGSSLVVPPLEEVFYRSFLYRYLARADFQSVSLGRFGWMPFLVTAVVFGSAHQEWLPGILCAFAYQGLVCWKKRLGDAIAAHAITNLLLGLWVVWRGAWHFW